jgi:hypothetical protein
VGALASAGCVGPSETALQIVLTSYQKTINKPLDKLMLKKTVDDLSLKYFFFLYNKWVQEESSSQKNIKQNAKKYVKNLLK